MVMSIGVYRPDQFRQLRIGGFYGRRRKFALDLAADVEQLGDSAITQAFIESIMDGAGVYKRTYSSRFPTFDREIVACLAKLQNFRPLRILDAAVSDGTTSVEFFNRVAEHVTPDFHFIASDRDGGFFVLNRRKSPNRRVIVSAQGEIVQAVYPPFVFSGGKPEKLFLFPINCAARAFAMFSAKKLVQEWKAKDSNLEAQSLIFACKPFRDLLATDRRLEFMAWDITTPWAGSRVHCIRAMNILNPSYFSKDQLSAIVQNLMESLVEGGLLAIGSNEGPESEVDGAIFRVEGGRLAELKSSGTGSRCRKAIKSLLAPSKVSYC